MTDEQKTAAETVVVNEAKDEKELDEAIDMSLAVLPLEATEQRLMLKIIEAPTKEELQYQLELFNINQSKKNAMRVVKLNNLLNKVEDQAIERIEKRPDQVPTSQLLDYMKVVSEQIDRAQKSVDSIKDSPAIHITNQKNEVNINVGPQLDRDSKEKVMDVISALLKQVQKDPQVIDAEIVTHEPKAEHIDILEADIAKADTQEMLKKEEN